MTTLIDLDILTTGDLELDNGDLVFVRGLDAVRQRVSMRISIQLGEWAFDTEQGLDYLGEVFRKDASIPLIRSRVLTLIASAPGVLQVRFLDVRLNGRTLSVQYVFLVDPDFLTEDEQEAVEATGTVTADVDSGELNFLLEPVGQVI